MTQTTLYYEAFFILELHPGSSLPSASRHTQADPILPSKKPYFYSPLTLCFPQAGDRDLPVTSRGH